MWNGSVGWFFDLRVLSFHDRRRRGDRKTASPFLAGNGVDGVLDGEFACVFVKAKFACMVFDGPLTLSFREADLLGVALADDVDARVGVLAHSSDFSEELGFQFLFLDREVVGVVNFVFDELMGKVVLGRVFGFGVEVFDHFFADLGSVSVAPLENARVSSYQRGVCGIHDPVHDLVVSHLTVLLIPLMHGRVELHYELIEEGMFGYSRVVSAEFELGFPILEGGGGALSFEAVGAIFERIPLMIWDLEKPVKLFDIVSEVSEVFSALEGEVVVEGSCSHILRFLLYSFD